MAISNIKTQAITGFQLVRELTPTTQAALPDINFAEALEPKLPKGPADNAAENRYAYIMRDGDIIGEVFNSGMASFFRNSDAAQVDLPEDGYGPELAQKRAEAMVEALGGTIVKAGTAMDQAGWMKTPAAERIMGTDAYIKQRDMAAQNAYNAQRIAQTREQVAAQRKAEADEATKDFMDFMEMTPAERIRAQVLMEMGITEDDLKKLDTKKRREAEDEISARIKDKVERGMAQSDDQNKNSDTRALGRMEAAVKTMADKAIEQVAGVHPRDEVREVNDGAKTLGVVLDKYNLSSVALQKKRSPLFDDA